MPIPLPEETSQIPAFRLRLAQQMADYRRRLADQVKHERETKSISRETLANRSGVSAKTIKRIEDQKVDNPRPVTIRRIAEALDVSPDKLRPPGELEQDQLERIEAKLDALLIWAEIAEIEQSEDQQPEQDEEATGEGDQ
jgi:transcriptional regulator with XRE-family HTH domain